MTTSPQPTGMPLAVAQQIGISPFPLITNFLEYAINRDQIETKPKKDKPNGTSSAR